MAQPDIVFKHGPCVAAVFSGEVTKGEKTIQTRTVMFQKRYRDQKGEWKTAPHLEVDDIPKAVLVLQKAFDYLTAGGCRQNEEEA